MAFPQVPLTVVAEIQLSTGVWQDISSDVYARDGGVVSITRGRPDEASTFDPSSMTFELNNRSGIYSPRNPVSPYYGLIGRNTPIRLSVLTGTPYLAATGVNGDYAGTPDASALHITSDLDVAVDATLVTWGVDGASRMLAGRYDATGGRSWLFGLFAGYLYLRWTTDGTLGTAVEAVAGVALTIPPGRRLAVRATLDVDNGASGNTTTFYTAPTAAGPWTVLDTVTHSGTTSIYAGTAPLVTGGSLTGLDGFAGAQGRIHSLTVRSGIGGTAVANPDFTGQSVGATTFSDGAGRTWTLHGSDAITNRNPRFAGEVVSWPPRWQAAGADAWVPIEAAGIKRRLGAGTQPQLETPLRRAITAQRTLVDYWPLEDAAGATMAGSAAPNGRPITPTLITYGADATLPGSAALPTIATGGHLTAPVRAGYTPSPTTPWSVEMMIKLPSLPGTLAMVVQASTSGMTTTGTPIASVQLWASTSSVQLVLADSDGNTIASASDPSAAHAAILTGWARLALGSDGSGGWQAVWGAVGANPQYLFVGLPATTANGVITQVSTGTVTATFGGMALGHVAITSLTPNSLDPVYLGADNGWLGETAAARLARLCAEEGVPLELTGQVTRTMPMGYQQPATLLDTLQACADADGGLLYEPRDVVGLAYRDRPSLYNQAPTVIPYSRLVLPLEPTDDDQRTRNDITVQRLGGVSARATLTTGRMSVQPPPAGAGTYEANQQLSLADDSWPAQIAGWLLHLGTVDELRYPVVTVYLQRTPAILAAVAALDVGSRMQITGVPLGLLPPGAIDQLAEGYTETLAQMRWEVTINAGPASPWSVGVLDDLVLARADSDGSYLDSAITSSQTAVVVDSQPGAAPWTTAAGDLPLDVVVGGERMTVTAVTTQTPGGVFTPTIQLATVIRSVNGVIKAHTANEPVVLADPTIIAL